MYFARETEGYEHYAVCMAVGFDKTRCRLRLPDEYQYVDYGLDLYAPQTNIDAAGRRVMVAWMRMPKAVEKKGCVPWNGMMCLPRIVEYEDGHIYFRVHPAVDEYFGKEVLGQEKVFGNASFDEDAGGADSSATEKFGSPAILSGKPLRIQVTLNSGECLDIGGFRIWEERDFIRTDRKAVFDDICGYRMMSNTPRLHGRYKLDIFVEPNLIEVFVNDGEYVISNVVYGLGNRICGRVERVFAGK